MKFNVIMPCEIDCEAIADAMLDAFGDAFVDELGYPIYDALDATGRYEELENIIFPDVLAYLNSKKF